MTQNTYEGITSVRRGFSDPRTEQDCKYDIVVMVQGDEPLTHPNMINEAVEPMLRDSSIKVVNCLEKLRIHKIQDRNCIKVVCDLNGDALYSKRTNTDDLENKQYQNVQTGMHNPIYETFFLIHRASPRH